MQSPNRTTGRVEQRVQIRSAGIPDISDILAAQLGTFPDDPANLDAEGFADAIRGENYRVLVAACDSGFAG